MSQAVSASSLPFSGLARVCRTWEGARATVCRRRSGKGPKVPRRRAPQGPRSDADLRARIEEELAPSPWSGEGHRRRLAQLRMDGLPTSQRLVLRVSSKAGFLASTWTAGALGPQVHDGTMAPERADHLWGTDRTTTVTEEQRGGDGLHPRRRRSLDARVPWGACRPAGHPLRSAPAAPARRPGDHQGLGRRSFGDLRPHFLPRPRQPVPLRRLPGRVPLPRYPLERGLRPPSRGQRLRRTLPAPSRSNFSG